MNTEEKVKQISQQVGLEEIEKVVSNLKEESSQQKSPEEWFKEEFLKKCSIEQNKESHPDSLFFMKDGEIIMEQDDKNNCFYVIYPNI